MIEIIGEYLNLIAQGCPFTTINADGSQRKGNQKRAGDKAREDSTKEIKSGNCFWFGHLWIITLLPKN